MDFEFPQFPERIVIDATRSWTATFDSYDQRKEDIYYLVTLYEGETRAARFFACVFPWWAGENWNTPDFAEKLKKAIHAVAETGKANTEYTGSLQGWMAAGGRSPLDLDGD